MENSYERGIDKLIQIFNSIYPLGQQEKSALYKMVKFCIAEKGDLLYQPGQQVERIWLPLDAVCIEWRLLGDHKTVIWHSSYNEIFTHDLSFFEVGCCLLKRKTK